MDGTSSPIPLIGCGILKDEIDFLIKKNGWNLRPRYLNSSLHVDFARLKTALSGALRREGEESGIVFYGTCHPQMDQILGERFLRTEGQNCVEILLGPERFEIYLKQGAFFLMEDWARRWDTVMTAAFGDRPEVIREIFREEHRFLLALRTVCSGDFSEKAEELSERIGLPLRWLDVELNHLEAVLRRTLGDLTYPADPGSASHEG